MRRTATPVQDFMEWRGWVWGPWRGDRLQPPPRQSAFDREAKRLATLAWQCQQAKAWHWRNRGRSIERMRAYYRRTHAA